jgi:uncharacterized membrane protein YdjX (TVP38/TMEM64 family)
MALRKYVTAGVLLCLLAVVCWFLFETPMGQQARSDPRRLSMAAHAFIDRHWLLAPLCFTGIYLLLGVLALPIWWLQILGGIGFGLYYGCFLSLVASTLCAMSTLALVRWMAGDWFHSRIESRMEKLKKLDQTLGHNGFLVVMTVRLMHLLPFGLCNYCLGLTEISYVDVALGTFIGSIPALSVYTGLGAGYRPLHNWKFDMAVGAINIVLLVPLALRYLRPAWFKKIGVE